MIQTGLNRIISLYYSSVIKNGLYIGQWLVLDKVSAKVQLRESRPLRAKCTRRRCSESDVYWPGDGFCHDEESALRDRLCASPDTVLTTDEYGEGYCKCHDGGKVPYVQIVSADNDDDFYNQDSQPCYPVYSKGACPRNHVLTPRDPVSTTVNDYCCNIEVLIRPFFFSKIFSSLLSCTGFTILAYYRVLLQYMHSHARI